MAMSEKGEVIIISKLNIRPSAGANQHEDGEARPQSNGGGTIHLTPWDLRLISMNYIQKGILFPKPPTCHPIQQTVSSLLSSFSAALDLFFPLAGSLHATECTASSTLTVTLECTGQGAEFVHASAPAVTISELLNSYHIPHIVRSFFPLNGLYNYEGRHKPLLAAQVTERSDGIFIALSLNHAVADGTSFWHFFNTWSEICRSSAVVGGTLDFERWFPDSCPPPLCLPFRRVEDIVRTMPQPPIEECFFHFSADSVAKLKSRAI